jgi:hypothetical protein
LAKVLFNLTHYNRRLIELCNSRETGRRPETFRRITGVDVELFKEMAEKIRPLWEKRRDNLEEGGETTVSTGMKTIY